MCPSLRVDLRRTNKYLRLTLFFFGYLIVSSVAGFVAVFLDFDNSAFKILSLVASVVCFVVAQTLVRRYKLYHFGIEEAVAIAGVCFFVIFAATILSSNDFSTTIAFAATTLGLLVLFLRFGYMYAVIGATVVAPTILFDLDQSDTLRRLVAIALMLTIFFVARERRLDHDPDHPADVYAAVEGVAWGVMYLVINLQISGWISVTDSVPLFYWATYVMIWLVPAAGLWIADSRSAARAPRRQYPPGPRHVHVEQAVSRCGAEALGSDSVWPVAGRRRTGPAPMARRAAPMDHARASWPNGCSPRRERSLAQAGSAAVFAPGAPAHTTSDSGPAIGGGGRSGGAGAEGSF